MRRIRPARQENLTDWVDKMDMDRGCLLMPLLLIAFLVLVSTPLVTLVVAQEFLQMDNVAPQTGQQVAAVTDTDTEAAAEASPTPAEEAAPVEEPTAAPTAEEEAATEEPAGQAAALEYDPAVVAEGAEVFGSLCAACHGPDARGLPNLGLDLVHSEFVASQSDQDLLTFVKTGRPVWDPANTTGVDMPPRGGNPALSDEQILSVIAYLRTLATGP